MTTFLEFAIAQHQGPPYRTDGQGQSWWWNCPRCGEGVGHFHTMMNVAQYKHRAKCHRCGLFGDIFDLLAEWFPNENYGDRLARVDRLMEEYRRQGGRVGVESRELHSRGVGTVDPGKVEQAWNDATDEMVAEGLDLDEVLRAIRTVGPKRLDVLYVAYQILFRWCERYGAPLLDVVRYWVRFDEVLRDQRERHARTCKDPKCVAWCKRMNGKTARR